MMSLWSTRNRLQRQDRDVQIAQVGRGDFVVAISGAASRFGLFVEPGTAGLNGNGFGPCFAMDANIAIAINSNIKDAMKSDVRGYQRMEKHESQRSLFALALPLRL